MKRALVPLFILSCCWSSVVLIAAMDSRTIAVKILLAELLWMVQFGATGPVVVSSGATQGERWYPTLLALSKEQQQRNDQRGDSLAKFNRAEQDYYGIDDLPPTWRDADAGGRRRRRQRRGTADGVAQECINGCCRYSLHVNMSEALPGVRVLRGETADIGYCAAAGAAPCITSNIYARLLRSNRPDLVHCIPSSYDKVAIFFENLETGDPDSVHLPNARVRTCGCGG